MFGVEEDWETDVGVPQQEPAGVGDQTCLDSGQRQESKGIQIGFALA